DRAGAEQALREAERLAPANGDVQWRLANLMLRQGNTEGSLDSFRVAIKANPGLLPAALDLVWRYSRGSSDELNRIVPDEPPLKVRLARFLIHQGRPSESLEVFNSIGARSSRACPESWDFLQDLLATENVGEARNVWLSLIGDKPGDESSAAVFNSGFESDPAPTRDQFDWKVTPTAAAQVFIDTGTFHSGGRSLRIEFVGHETTRLDGTVKELTVIKPGAHYKLEFYSRSENLVTSDGPRIALSSVAFPEWTAKSGPIAAGTSDWRSESVDFVAPGVKGGPAIPVIISFIRTPKLNYEEPMRGIVWLDDFSLNEVKQ
ncbi:MAG TPA: tetratricopeptide repeat protein, partial [Blastocatellia bacterium]|nr:tetratricopeptide repeat protein [Blastocatellia bacterium]